MHQEKYSLTWQTYSDHLKSMMKELMMNEDFSDITLVTEDKQHIKANINILRACSPVFKEILKKERNSTQIMYLRAIQFSEMESIMQFIYLGEATFYEERMNEFLAVAKSLEIKELCNAEPETREETNDEPDVEPERRETIHDEPDDEPSQNDPYVLTEELRDKSDHMNKQTQKDKRGIVSVNGKYECEQCHKTYSGSGALYTHKQSAHQGVKYACDKCDYQASRKDHLTAHIQSKHEGIKYACVQCDYQATTQGNLTQHIQAKHEGIKYACDKCDHQSTTQSNLRTHMKKMHQVA